MVYKYLAAVLLLVGCGIKPSGKLASDKKDEKTECGESHEFALQAEVTYEKDIKPILSVKCTWCHSDVAADGNRQKPYLHTYELAVEKAESSVEEMKDAEMPPSGEQPQLGETDLTTFKAWIAQGAKRGEPVVFETTDEVPGYDPVIKQLLDTRCIGCHGAGGTPPQLTDYDSAVSAGADSLAAIQNGTMPPGSPLDAATINVFAGWVDAEYPATGGEPMVPPAQDSVAGTDSGQAADATSGNSSEPPIIDCETP